MTEEKTENRENMVSVDLLLDQIETLCTLSCDLLEKQIRNLNKAPKIKIPGHLKKSSHDGHVRWIRVLDADESKSGKRENRYLNKTDEKIKKQLAYKLFCECSLRVKEKQMEASRAYLRKIRKVGKYSLRIVNDPDIRHLLGKNNCDQAALHHWVNEDYPKNPKNPELLRIAAAGGRKVRSKSEALIVAELVRLNVPFRYECALQLPGFTVYPDFMIRHPVTGKIVLWEHLGLMEDGNYAENAVRKIEAYAAAGYIPMVNLILTSETRDHPLDYKIVRTLAEYFFQLSI